MDTVERKRIAYRLQLYLTNLTHNGHFFYYASYFVIIMNAIGEEESREILGAFSERMRFKMPEREVFIGVSDQVKDIVNLHLAYKRARAAAEMAQARKIRMQYFDQMGLYRMLYLVEDRALLRDLSDKPLAPLLEYDREHNGEYIATLESYLNCGGSIKAMSEELYIHRNTILYRMANIKRLLGCSLETPEERLVYTVAGDDGLLAKVKDISFSDKLFIFARSRADMVELAFDRCGNLTSRPGSASANSISERIVDAAVDGSDRIEESGSDRDFSLTVAVAHSCKLQADIVSERAEAVVVFDKFFVVHGIVSPAIMSIN